MANAETEYVIRMRDSLAHFDGQLTCFIQDHGREPRPGFSEAVGLGRLIKARINSTAGELRLRQCVQVTLSAKTSGRTMAPR